MEPAFIGVDLAWRGEGGHTGVVALRGGVAGARLVAHSDGITSLSGVADFIGAHATADTVVAIDAPLIIANTAGQRPCETEIGRRFGRFHASCHASNLSLYPDPAGVRVVALLAEQGFRHDPLPDRALLRNGRWLFEVYPHPAQVVLFGLGRIIKYKRGRADQRRAGLRRLQEHLRRLCRGCPPLEPTPELDQLLGCDVNGLRGPAAKRYEDILDALFCAYLALHYWRWGAERNQMIGDLRMGYIIVPTKPLDEAPPT